MARLSVLAIHPIPTTIKHPVYGEGERRGVGVGGGGRGGGGGALACRYLRAAATLIGAAVRIGAGNACTPNASLFNWEGVRGEGGRVGGGKGKFRISVLLFRVS